MTAPNSIAVQRCIGSAVKDAGINATDIDGINGHLTATSKDATEIKNWKQQQRLQFYKTPSGTKNLLIIEKLLNALTQTAELQSEEITHV